MKYPLLFASLIFWFTSIFGQEPHYINYTTEDGLPSSCVYQIRQDRNNNIWFATNNGVSKYNGASFRNYSNTDGLESMAILKSYEDMEGKLYFISIESLIYIYDSVLDRMEMFPVFDENKEVMESYTQSICSFQVLKNGEFKVGFTGREGFAQIEKNGRIHFHRDTTLEEGIHLETLNDQVFFYGNDFSNYLTVNGKKNSYNNTSRIQLKANSLKNGFVALSQEKELTLIHNDSIVDTKVFKKTIIEVNSDEKKNIWVSFYRGGTKCYMIVENKLVEKKHVLKKYSVTAVLEDHEGGYWFSTLESGVYYTPNVNIKFFNTESGLSGLNAVDITGNGDDEVVIGYSDGSITVFRSDTIFRIFDNQKRKIISHNRLKNVEYDQLNDQYLIATFGNPVILKNGEVYTDKFESINCHFLLPDKRENGFWYINNKEIGYVRNDSLIYEFPCKNFSQSNLMYDFEGNVVLTEGQNRNVYTREGEIHKSKNDNKETLRVSYGYQIHDSIQIKHLLDGVVISQPHQENVFHNESRNTLVKAVFEAPNKLWITSNNGLYSLALEDDKMVIKKKSKEIGILNTDLKDIFNLKESLWIHSTRGLYVIDKKDIVSTIPIAPTVNTISSRDSTYRNPEQNFVFKSNENNLTFQLQAITFKYKGEYKFEYQLDGINEQYTELRGDELNLTNLDYSNYTLNYRIKTINGIYSPISSYSFQISTPFSETWWFITVIIIGYLIIIILIVKKIFNRILTREKKKSEMKELIHSLRLQSIQSQFNPHFTFNAVSSIQHHISASTIDEAKNYLGMFSSIMRSILLNSEKETIPLAEELKLLETYLNLEKLRFKDKLSYEFKIAPSVDPEYDRIPPMIIQPILENAINYGLFNKPEGGTILIDFKVNDDVLYCTIEDDGIGYEAVKKIQDAKRIKSSGKGLNLVKERLGVNNKHIKDNFEKIDLFDSNGLAVGTKVILKIELND